MTDDRRAFDVRKWETGFPLSDSVDSGGETPVWFFCCKLQAIKYDMQNHFLRIILEMR